MAGNRTETTPVPPNAMREQSRGRRERDETADPCRARPNMVDDAPAPMTKVGRLAESRLEQKEDYGREASNITRGGQKPPQALSSVEKGVPDFQMTLQPRRSVGPQLPIMDTSRLQEDIGFSPAFDIRSAV